MFQPTPIVVGATSEFEIPDAEFIDFPFTVEGVTYADHLDRVRAVEPTYAVAPDIEPGDDVETRLAQAAELNEYAETVIIVPKAIHPTDVPTEYRVGIPMQASFGSGAPWSVWEYRDCGPVHLLGGPPAALAATAEYVSVGSLDTNTLHLGARFGDVWNGSKWEYRDDLSFYERVKYSYLTFYEQVNDTTLPAAFKAGLEKPTSDGGAARTRSGTDSVADSRDVAERAGQTTFDNF